MSIWRRHKFIALIPANVCTFGMVPTQSFETFLFISRSISQVLSLRFWQNLKWLSKIIGFFNVFERSSSKFQPIFVSHRPWKDTTDITLKYDRNGNYEIKEKSSSYNAVIQPRLLAKIGWNFDKFLSKMLCFGVNTIILKWAHCPHLIIFR